MKTLLKMLMCISFLFLFLFAPVGVYSWSLIDDTHYQEYLIDMDDPYFRRWDIA